jgi:hypothetical protein
VDPRRPASDQGSASRTWWPPWPSSSPSAARADSAARAVEAGSAETAGFADAAGNATRLDGLGASDLARAVQIDSGSGDNSATSQTVLISFPEAGLEIRTDGDPDATNQLRFVNSSERTCLYWTTGSPLSVGTLGAGANIEVQGPGSAPLNHDAVLAVQSGSGFEPSPVISITCRFSAPPTVACIGYRSL